MYKINLQPGKDFVVNDPDQYYNPVANLRYAKKKHPVETGCESHEKNSITATILV
jgi:hypothetical protein